MSNEAHGQRPVGFECDAEAIVLQRLAVVGREWSPDNPKWPYKPTRR